MNKEIFAPHMQHHKHRMKLRKFRFYDLRAVGKSSGPKCAAILYAYCVSAAVDYSPEVDYTPIQIQIAFVREKYFVFLNKIDFRRKYTHKKNETSWKLNCRLTVALRFNFYHWCHQLLVWLWQLSRQIGFMEIPRLRAQAIIKLPSAESPITSIVVMVVVNTSHVENHSIASH